MRNLFFIFKLIRYSFKLWGNFSPKCFSISSGEPGAEEISEGQSKRIGLDEILVELISADESISKFSATIKISAN